MLLTTVFSRQYCCMQTGQAQLINNEVMIHRLVDATVPSIIKSDLGLPPMEEWREQVLDFVS